MSTAEEAAGRQPLKIRKYPNRRYYDATHSRHLTLDEIRTLVRDGHDIQIVDSATEADITPQVLTQIILELETTKLETFPVTMLVQMIRANERVVTDFMQNYFTQAFTAYLEYQKQMSERFRQLHAVPPGLNPLAAWSQAILNPFASGTQKAPAGESTAQPEMTAVIAELKQQITELRAELKKRRRR